MPSHPPLCCSYVPFLALGDTLFRQELAWHRWQLGLFIECSSKREKRTIDLFTSDSLDDFFFSKVGKFMPTCVDLYQNRLTLL